MLMLLYAIIIDAARCDAIDDADIADMPMLTMLPLITLPFFDDADIAIIYYADALMLALRALMPCCFAARCCVTLMRDKRALLC